MKSEVFNRLYVNALHFTVVGQNVKITNGQRIELTK